MKDEREKVWDGIKMVRDCKNGIGKEDLKKGEDEG